MSSGNEPQMSSSGFSLLPFGLGRLSLFPWDPPLLPSCYPALAGFIGNGFLFSGNIGGLGGSILNLFGCPYLNLSKTR